MTVAVCVLCEIIMLCWMQRVNLEISGNFKGVVNYDFTFLILVSV